MDQPELTAAAQAWGIETEYWDVWGKPHQASPKVEKAILASLGVDVTGKSIGLGHYINENTYVSVSPNFGGNVTSGIPSEVASIQYFLQRWLTVTTATMSDGSRQVFVNVNKRY